MDSTHVIALIAAVLQVRNQVAIASAGDDIERREHIAASLGDPIDEARELIRQVMSDEPKLPPAPNTMARGGLPKE